MQHFNLESFIYFNSLTLKADYMPKTAAALHDTYSFSLLHLHIPQRFFYLQNSTDNLNLLPMRDQTFNINVQHRQLLGNFYIINEKTIDPCLRRHIKELRHNR